jgi:hypothetical protein
MADSVATSLVELTDAELNLVAGGAAPADPNAWGQAVKTANQDPNGYPNGGNRGSYVSGQAQDSQTPGYAYEIHTLAPVGSGPNPT